MSKLEALKAEARTLSREEQVQLLEWLADYLENEAELDPTFAASIDRGKTDLRKGQVRVVQH